MKLRTRGKRNGAVTQLRPATEAEFDRHGEWCQGAPGCANDGTLLFKASSRSRYGYKRILLCKECADPKVLFSLANRPVYRVGEIG